MKDRSLTKQEKESALKRWRKILEEWEHVQVDKIYNLALSAQPSEEAYGECPFCPVYYDKDEDNCDSCPLYQSESCSNDCSKNILYWQICRLLYRQHKGEKVPELKGLIEKMIAAIDAVEVEDC